MPTLTATLSLPTSTVIPTLDAAVAKAEILRLLSTNDECAFPCWWGMIPGETRYQDAQNFLNSFSIWSVGKPEFDKEDSNIWIRFPETHDSFISIAVEFEGENEVLHWLQVSVQALYEVAYPEGSAYEISWSDPVLAPIIKPYSISRLALKYGQPSEVLLFTHKAVMLNQPHPLSLVMFYPEHGFMVEYVMDTDYQGTYPDVSIRGCPASAFLYFWFWSPLANLTIKDATSLIQGYQLDYESVDSGRFRTLEDATDMSIEEFYSLYTTNEKECINAPAELWPMPGQ